MRNFGWSSPFYVHWMCAVCGWYRPFIPLHHALSLSLRFFLHPLSGSSGRTQTPVARCVALIQYWHKGGMGTRCVYVLGAATHTKWIILTRSCIQSAVLPSSFSSSSIPATRLTFVPALNCEKAHCNQATCRLIQFVLFGTCLGIIFISYALQMTTLLLRGSPCSATFKGKGSQWNSQGKCAGIKLFVLAPSPKKRKHWCHLTNTRNNPLNNLYMSFCVIQGAPGVYLPEEAVQCNIYTDRRSIKDLLVFVFKLKGQSSNFVQCLIAMWQFSVRGHLQMRLCSLESVSQRADTPFE